MNETTKTLVYILQYVGSALFIIMQNRLKLKIMEDVDIKITDKVLNVVIYNVANHLAINLKNVFIDKKEITYKIKSGVLNEFAK